MSYTTFDTEYRVANRPHADSGQTNREISKRNDALRRSRPGLHSSGEHVILNDFKFIRVEPIEVPLDLDGSTKQSITALPSICPRCRESAVPKVWSNACILGEDDYFLEIAVQCPSCSQLFIAEYDIEQVGEKQWEANLTGTVPRSVAQTVRSRKLSRISPRFFTVFDEASAAEQSGLLQICGAGYRKALEILVKDYLIHKQPKSKMLYRQTGLRSCIKDHIQDEVIREIADGAASLGNEQTHYSSDFTPKDVEELKSLITLVSQWIELHEVTDETRRRLQRRKKRK